MLATNVSCPACHGILKSSRPLRPGKNVQCLKCGTYFSVPGPVAVPVAVGVAPPAATPVAVGVAPPAAVAARSPGRVLVLTAVLGGLVLFLGGGLALAVYCFSHEGDANGTPTQHAGKRHRRPAGGGPSAQRGGGGEAGTVRDGDGNGNQADDSGNQGDGQKVPPADSTIGTLKQPKSDLKSGNQGLPPEPLQTELKSPAGAIRTQGALSDARQREVNEAIDRGVYFLRHSQLPSGTWQTGENDVGYAALPGLTLLECGVPASDPAVQKAAAFVRKSAGRLNQVHHQTYQLSLAILFLGRLDEERDRELLRALALRLVAGQNAAGGWTYRCPSMTAADQQQLLTFLKQHQTPPLPELIAKNSPVKLQDPLAKPDDPMRIPIVQPIDPKLLTMTHRPGNVLFYPVLRHSKSGQVVDLTRFIESRRIGVIAPVVVPDPKDDPTRPPDRRGNKKPPPVKKLPASQLTQTVRNLPVVQNILAGKPRPVPAGNDDNSNSQFALMALWVARRYDVPVERTMALVLERYHGSQNGDGGWGYHVRAPTKDTMTCVGLIGLAMGHGTAQEARAHVAASQKGERPTAVPADPAIKNGLKKLGTWLDHPARSRKGVRMVNLYLLWSVERVGVLYNLKTIGNKDWYGWGVEILLNHQKSNGSWFTSSYIGSSTPLDTSMALLFLKRANFISDLTENMRLFMPVRDPEAR